MDLWHNHLYQKDLHYVSELALPWETLHGKTVLISGATGMIGRFLSDVLMYKNNTSDLQCTVCALGRSREKAETRFSAYWNDEQFHFVECNINKQAADIPGKADYILHFASNTHPVAYSADPIGTITANIIGTQNLLELAIEKGASRFLFASSVEIYGENRGDVERFDENYCGYIDCNTVRAGYPESKRCGEALCQAYIRQEGIDAVIARLPRTFGSTMQMSDTKAITQFIKKGIANENIILKSEGAQLYSYGYVADVVAGILFCMLKGECGKAYNISDQRCDITLRDLTKSIAEYVGVRVMFELPDLLESAGYSVVSKALMDGGRIKGLGWEAAYDIHIGVRRTIDILKSTL